MKQVTRYETSDGVVHKTLDEARHHADERFGAAICPIARDLANIDKYSRTLEYLQTYLGVFVNLAQLRDDMSLENPPDDTED